MKMNKMVVLKRTGVCVWCGGLKLDKIGLLNLGEYWCWFYGSRKLVSPALPHMVAQFTLGTPSWQLA